MKIILKGNPISKVRHRCRCAGKHGIAYDPQASKEMKQITREMLKEIEKAFQTEDKEILMEASNLALAESFQMKCTFLFGVPKSFSQAQKNMKFWGFDSHNIKPDFDNLAKLYADCGKGIFWPDDCQITIATQCKFFDENPRTEIEVMANKKISLHENFMKVFKTFSPGEMNEFLNDATFLVEKASFPLAQILKKSEMGNHSSDFEAVAEEVIKFASKYADKLKKVKSNES